MRHQFGRWATASRPRLLRLLTKRKLTVLDLASIPEKPMNLSLLSAQGISRKEVLVFDLGLNGFVTDLRVGRPNGLPACLQFELMDPVGSLELNSVLNFPHALTAHGVDDPDDYLRWLADDPALPPLGSPKSDRPAHKSYIISAALIDDCSRPNLAVGRPTKRSWNRTFSTGWRRRLCAHSGCSPLYDRLLQRCRFSVQSVRAIALRDFRQV